MFRFKSLTHFIIGVPLKQEPPGVKKKPCGAFQVTWNPPSLDSGGGPLTGYQFQLKLRKGNGGWRNCTAFFSNHSCLFTNLRSKTEYDVRVRAFNQNGSSQWAYTLETTDLFGKSFILILLLYYMFFYSTLLAFFLLLLNPCFHPSSTFPLLFEKWLHSFSNCNVDLWACSFIFSLLCFFNNKLFV